jgi:hypothetical protein
MAVHVGCGSFACATKAAGRYQSVAKNDKILIMRSSLFQCLPYLANNAVVRGS